MRTHRGGDASRVEPTRAARLSQDAPDPAGNVTGPLSVLNQLGDLLDLIEGEQIGFGAADVARAVQRCLEFAWFPASGLLSTIVLMEDGSSAESSAIGHEGLVGLTLALGETIAAQRVITQVDSESWRIPARKFRALAADNPGFRELLFRYAVALLQQARRNAACNRLHSVEQRMARWLLFTNDRVGEPEYNLTQTFLAEMLGVERPTVSVSAGKFQRAGLISYKRGRFKILDQERLKQAACECYQATTTVYRRLLGV